MEGATEGAVSNERRRQGLEPQSFKARCSVGCEVSTTTRRWSSMITLMLIHGLHMLNFALENHRRPLKRVDYRTEVIDRKWSLPLMTFASAHSGD